MAIEPEKPAMGTEETQDDSAINPADQSPEGLRAALVKLQVEKDRTADALKRANDEAKRHRLRKEELERIEAERNEAKLSDEERSRQAQEERERKVRETETEVSKLRDENLRLRLDAVILGEAQKKGFRYPELVPGTVDRDLIIVGEDGQIEGADKAVERLARQYPDLLNAGVNKGMPQSMRTHSPGGGGVSRANRAIDPYEQELNEMGRGGRM